MRRFNTEGPVRPDLHYCIPPLARLDDVDRVLGLVRDLRYFVLHAPRQTGKTSALLALRDLLNGGAAGDLHCVYVKCVQQRLARSAGEQTRRGKSQSPVAWMAGRRETDDLKPIDTATVKGGRRVTGP